MNSGYLADIIILLAAAVIAVPVSRTLRMGAVPGFLLAGIVVGPYGLGLITNVREIGYLAELGVVLLLFVIGIELKPSRLWLMRRLVFGLGTVQLLATGALITAIVRFAFDVPLQAAILIGPALALSSTAFVLQLLTEQKMLTSEYGRASVAVLLLQDLAVVPLLALASLLAMSSQTIGEDILLALIEALAILSLVILGGRYLLHPILHRVARSGTPEIFTASALLLVLGAAVLTEHAGLSMAMGAFVAGLLIADSAYRHQVMAEIQPFRGFLLGLFFMSTGMSLDLNYLYDKSLLPLGLVAALIVTKVVVLWPLTRLYGLRSGSGLAVSLILSQSGEFALVLFALAAGSGLLGASLFQQVLLVVILSMLATPPLAALAFRLAGRRGELRPLEGRVPGPVEPAPASIVLAGYGRVGHRIGQILAMAKIPYVAVDRDSAVVARERAEGRPVFYGDVLQPEVLRAAGAPQADMVIVTLDEFQATEQVISTLLRTHPGLCILARGNDLDECWTLRRLGASVVVSENLEASLELARAALARIGGNPEEHDALLRHFRQYYDAQPDAEPPLRGR
jgi:monovalent cation:proton antiporter-2 (CPA2) family protein